MHFGNPQPKFHNPLQTRNRVSQSNYGAKASVVARATSGHALLLGLVYYFNVTEESVFCTQYGVQLQQ